MGFREIKAAGRRVLHEKMKVPALYIEGEAEPLPVFVRVHSKWDALGEVKGTSFDYAEKAEVIPQILFDRAEVALPARHALVIVSATEGYRVDTPLPPDGFSITARVTMLRAAELVGQPVPTHG